MYWLRVLWAIVRGVAAGISAAKWDDFLAEKYGVKKKTAPPPDAPPDAPPADPFTGPAASSEPAPGVRVDVDRKEGQFSGGLPYMGGAADPRARAPQAAAAPRDGESRRKRRTRPTSPSPAEQVCARCKAVGSDLLTPDAESLAVAQESTQDEAIAVDVAASPASDVPTDAAARSEGDSAERMGTGENNGEHTSLVVPEEVRPALADRLVTRLGTRASLTRLAETQARLETNAMGA